MKVFLFLLLFRFSKFNRYKLLAYNFMKINRKDSLKVNLDCTQEIKNLTDISKAINF